MLLPEGGVGDPRRAARAIAPHVARRHASTPACCSPRRSRRGGVRGALRRARSRSRTRRPGRRGPGPSTAAATRKVAALERALAGADAWVTGIRREQAATRAERRSSSSATTSAACGSTTRSPTGPSRTCGARIHERDLPYHPLHDQGYASIGCAPCTQPGSGREGRWAGTDKIECGLHVGADMDPLVIVFGLGVGVLVGLTGIGGGSLMTPLLILVRRRASRSSRSAPTSPTARSPRRSAAGATCARARSTSACRSGWPSARVPGALARRRASSTALHDRYGDGFDDDAAARSSPCALLHRRRRGPRPRAVHAQVAERERRHASTLDDRRARSAPSAIGLVLGFVLGLTSVGSGALVGLALILRLPPDAAPRRRHRRLPRRAAAVGRRPRAPARRQRRLRPDGEHPHRLAARRVDRHRAAAARPRRRPAPGARLRAARLARSACSARPASTSRRWTIVGVPGARRRCVACAHRAALRAPRRPRGRPPHDRPTS